MYCKIATTNFINFEKIFPEVFTLNLPIEFEKNMISLLGEEEFEQYKAVLDDERFYGMRANTLKIDIADFKKIAREKLGGYADVPW